MTTNKMNGHELSSESNNTIKTEISLTLWLNFYTDDTTSCKNNKEQTVAVFFNSN